MPHRNPRPGRHRFRPAGRAFWAAVAVGLVVGAVVWTTYVVTFGPPGARRPDGTLAGAAVAGGLVGFAVLVPALLVHVVVALDHPRAARWSAAATAGVLVLGLATRLGAVPGPEAVALAVVGAAVVLVLAPLLLLRRPGPARTAPSGRR